ncbi:hypothetical protein AB4099_34310 [Bosea sp. 2KB_26]|uniref:hypothetical protein n=1 Tax=Bosea sp. 2KB_26 TaxID=3237475 RepID=UPI003F935745
MSTAHVRFPGVLNSKEMLVAESIQARAWDAVSRDNRLIGDAADAAKAKLGGIIIRLMSDGSKSINDLATEAVLTFRESAGG